jgi:acyl-CoA dehydrogenase
MLMETARASGLNYDLSPEQEMLRDMVRAFTAREATKADARAWEKSSEFPWELYQRLGAAGLYGIGIDEEYGGQGGNLIDQVIVCEELARTLAGLSVLWHLNCWSGAKAVSAHGTAAQKAAYLPKIAAGKLLFAIAMTEPGGGTDVLRAMKTRAQPTDAGFIVNGTKIWSTLAHVADYLLVLARTHNDDKPSKGLSVLIVDAKAPGVTARPIGKLGLRSLGSCEVVFDNVFVPRENLIGEAGSGWSQILGSLNNERILTAAMCTGMLAGVLEDAVAYAKTREAFGRPIGQYQAIQHKIADMKMNLDTARLHTFRAAWLQVMGRPCNVEATTAKCLASDYAVAGADEGIQILGGYGYADEFDMQRYWRDARLFKIGPITNEMARNAVAESLGLPRSF